MRIEKPCPVYLSPSRKIGDNFSCKSCQCTVVDFRDKTNEEINSELTDNTCGIFNNDQLTHQPIMSWNRSLLFSCLTFISFLGFNVQPIKAQSSAPVNLSKKQETPLKNGDNKRKERKEKRWLRKHKNYTKGKSLRTIGTPSF